MVWLKGLAAAESGDSLCLFKHAVQLRGVRADRLCGLVAWASQSFEFGAGGLESDPGIRRLACKLAVLVMQEGEEKALASHPVVAKSM